MIFFVATLIMATHSPEIVLLTDNLLTRRLFSTRTRGDRTTLTPTEHANAEYNQNN
jgi:hypothetical protein